MATDTPLVERLRGLIERLEKLEGPDRAVDHAIHATTNPPLRDGLRFGIVPAYSASLDAAVALVERQNPGHGLRHLAEAIETVRTAGAPLSELPKYVILSMLYEGISDA